MSPKLIVTIGAIGLSFSAAAALHFIKPHIPAITSAMSKAQPTKAAAEKEEPSPKLDAFTRIARSKSDEVIRLAKLMQYEVTLQGEITHGLSWEDFPDLARDVAKAYPDAKRLLQVDVGEPALLITRKTTFSTTGRFYLKAERYSFRKTTQGKVPVYVEFAEASAVDTQWENLRTDMKELTLQYLEQKVPEQLKSSKASRVSSLLKPSTIAALDFVAAMGKKPGDESEFFTYAFASALAHCSVVKDEKLSATQWRDEVQKLYPQAKDDVSFLKVSCADGGPFTNNERVLSFEDCMCNQEADPFLTNDSQSRKRFAKLITSLTPATQINISQSAVGKTTKEAIRAPASIETE
jgi:hypothetical protein